MSSESGMGPVGSNTVSLRTTPRPDFFLAGAGICCFVFLTIVFSPLCYLLNLPYAFACPSALAVTIALLWKAQVRMAGLAMILLNVAVCFVVAGIFYDYSVDGRAHLQESIIQLREGWNFLRSDFPLSESWWGWHWANDYPLGMQLFGVAAFDLLGDIQRGKAYSLLLVIGSSLMVYSCLSDFTQHKLAQVLGTIALVMHPVVIGQLWTYYVDGFLYLVFLTGLVCIYEIRSEHTRHSLLPWLCLTLSIPILPAVKISGILYAVILSGFALASIPRHLRTTFVLLFPTVLVALLICYRPYLQRPPSAMMEILSAGESRFPANLESIPTPLAFVKNMFSKPAMPYGEVQLGVALPKFHAGTSFGLYGTVWGLAFLLALWSCAKRIFKEKALWMVVVLVIPPLLYSGLLNQRYYSLGYLIPFLAFLHTGGLSKAFACRVLLPIHCVYLTYGLFGVVEKNILITSRIREQVAETVQLSADGKPTYLELQDTGAPIKWTERFLSDRLWVPGDNIFIINHAYNQARCEQNIPSTRKIPIQSGDKSVSIDLTDEPMLTVLRVSLDPECRGKIVANWRYSGRGGEDSGEVHTFSRFATSKPPVSVVFTMPPFTDVEIGSRWCVIEEIRLRHSVASELIPTNARLADLIW